MLRRITAVFNDTCDECGEPTMEGTRILWDTDIRKVYHADCDPSPSTDLSDDWDNAVATVGPAGLEDAVARELGREPKRMEIPKLTQEQISASDVDDKVKTVVSKLAHDVKNALRGNDPISIREWKGDLVRNGVPYELGVGPVSLDAVFDSDVGVTAADLAGWSEDAVADLIDEGREIILELKASPMLDRLGDIFEDLARRAND